MTRSAPWAPGFLDVAASDPGYGSTARGRLRVRSPLTASEADAQRGALALSEGNGYGGGSERK
ncbi:hypothetical protein GCM10020218_034600 [Dactylosporangium vinaceum]